MISFEMLKDSINYPVSRREEERLLPTGTCVCLDNENSTMSAWDIEKLPNKVCTDTGDTH